MNWGLILLILGIILILDSSLVLIFPKKVKNILQYLTKKDNLKNIVLIELIIGIILFVISFS
jgi:hypothetical protein